MPWISQPIDCDAEPAEELEVFKVTRTCDGADSASTLGKKALSALPAKLKRKDKDASMISARDDVLRHAGFLFCSFLSLSANALNQGDRSLMPFAVIPMADTFAWSMVEKGWVLSSFAVGYISMQLPGGWISTQVQQFRLLFAAVAGWSVCTLLTPVAAHMGLGILLSCRVCMGVAEGCCLPAILQIITLHVPVGMRSRAVALLVGCGKTGEMVALLACPVIPGWELIFTAFGAAGILWCVLAVVCWAKVDFAASGNSDHYSGRNVAEDEFNAVDELDSEKGVFLLQKLCASPGLLAICIAHFGQNWTNYIISSWFPTFLHEVFNVPVAHLYITALPLAVNALSGMVVGHLADLATKRYSLLSVRRIATAFGLLGPALCHILLAAATSSSAAIAAVTISSILGAAANSGYMANHTDITERHAGLTFGISNTLATIPGIAAGPVTAWLVHRSGGEWIAVFGLAASVNIVCAFIYAVFGQAHLLSASTPRAVAASL